MQRISEEKNKMINTVEVSVLKLVPKLKINKSLKLLLSIEKII